MDIEKIKVRNIAGGIVIKDERILLVKRKYEPNIGEWCIPAGYTEKENDESVEDCCIRETKEETNIDVEPIMKVGVFRRYNSKRNRYQDMHIFSCRAKSEEVIIDDEVLDVQWIALEELNKLNVVEEMREIILKYLGDQR